jgi:hypothetical protein
MSCFWLPTAATQIASPTAPCQNHESQNIKALDNKFHMPIIDVFSIWISELKGDKFTISGSKM